MDGSCDHRKTKCTLVFVASKTLRNATERAGRIVSPESVKQGRRPKLRGTHRMRVDVTKKLKVFFKTMRIETDRPIISA
jgi:hypothetical protein